MTVQEFLSRVTSKELAEWKLYYQEEPWGYEMWNWRYAMLACAIVSPFSKKGKKPKMKNFMPKKPNIIDGQNPYENEQL